MEQETRNKKLFVISLLLIIVFVLIIAVAVHFSSPAHPKSDLTNFIETHQYATTTVGIGGKTLVAELALTANEQSQGLSGRKTLDADHGMLFVFPRNDMYTFWMKDMLFPIDIIWINEAKKITTIKKSLTPDTYPKTFLSTTLSRFVLEVPAGFSEAHNLKVGDTVQFTLGK